MEYASYRRITSVSEPSPFEVVKITSSQDAARYARKFYHDDISLYESFFILMLNQANDTMAYAKISQGGVSGTVVDIKIVCKLVVDNLSSSVIFIHNHPSGNLTPSNADKELTKKAANALSFLDVKLFDHIILTEDSYTSFADSSIMP